jgi:hypothetical protein
MGNEGGLDAIGRSDEKDLGIQMPRRGHRAVNHRIGRAIAAHRVNSDADHDLRLFFVDRSDSSALVKPAVRTDPMRSLWLVALRTHPGRRGGQRIMGAPLGGACL